MSGNIGHAIYGERNRGHELLAASPAFPNARAIVGRMDLQGSPPPHGEWKPYLSGFGWEGIYVLARTMPDRGADRSGMVFSRALAIPAAAAAAMADIGGMIETLEALGDARDGVEDLEWRPAAAVPRPSVGLVRALLDSKIDPVIWPGQASFSEAVTALWANLWPAARMGLSFRIAFSPQDVASAAPTVVTTPPALLTRWAGFTIAVADADTTPANASESLLAGDGTPSPFRDLVGRIAARMPAVKELPRIEELQGLLREGGRLGDLIDGLRLVCHLCPEKSEADEEKRALVERAAGVLPTALTSEVRMARNLDLSAVPRPEAFWSGCEAWAERALWQERDGDLIGAALEDAFSTRPVEPWRSSVASGALRALAKRPADTAPDLWRATLRNRELLAAVLDRFRPSAAVDRALAHATPADLGAKGSEFVVIAARTTTPLLHAACCAGSFPTLEAVRQHLAAFPDAGRDAVLIAARKATAPELVGIALASDDEVTLGVAADACASRPTLLRDLDVLDARWRALWLAALNQQDQAWKGPRHPQQSMAQLLDECLDGPVDADQLLGGLAETPLANLLAYPRRAKIWSRLPARFRPSYIGATALAWITSFEAGAQAEAPAPDPVLADALASPQLVRPLLERLAARPARCVALFRALPQIPEEDFAKWLAQAIDQGLTFDAAAAKTAGSLIASRQWDRVARNLADAVLDRARDDLRPSLAYVVDMIGSLRRFQLDLLGQTPPASAKWQILEEVAVELYGWGPGQDGLWERAGGKAGDIPKADTGAEAWRMVVLRAAKGKGDIDLRRLIETMATDYPKNPTIGKMRWDPLFRDRT